MIKLQRDKPIDASKLKLLDMIYESLKQQVTAMLNDMKDVEIEGGEAAMLTALMRFAAEWTAQTMMESGNSKEETLAICATFIEDYIGQFFDAATQGTKH